ncbi:hypothetical protein [Streptosporangium sp. V21-05]|uniref:hypothetical protein n=1 Tax=Streptosporangium sp. V21-05 TaxID=3446115 RepID=UPI003F52D2C9
MLASKVEAACRKFQEIFASCEGSYIDAVTFGAIGERDYLDFKLIQTQKWGVVTVLLEDVRYFKISKGDDLVSVFVDEVSVSYLPKTNQSWPDEAEGLVTRFSGLPELYWVRVAGPATISAVAAIMTVSVSRDSPESH